ncbi:MAG: tRNA (guanosine(37)-N1)-methyltransferase TrmD [Lachnospiraceae bacterium]|nr:tRNA (guanosine(37)-N1)-methyltransferase TrmD [Lachnospiraceae bacterium]
MEIYILTLFPDMIQTVMRESIVGRAQDAGHIKVHAVNIRDYSTDKHKKVDDYPYGGGAGMVMFPQPIYDAVMAVRAQVGREAPVIYLTPQGKTFSQEMAHDFAGEDALILLCGHYEGIDERVIEEVVDAQVSIGDYVLTGGELAAMVVADAVARLVPGVLHNQESAGTESFEDGLLEYPQYTRPRVWRNREVPEILLSGDHAKVDAWRHEQSVERTKQMRPDLIKKAGA